MVESGAALRAGLDHYAINASVALTPAWRLPAVASAARAAAVSVTIAAAAAEVRLARFGLVDLDVATLEVGIVELPDRVGNFFRSCHLDKAETFRLSGEFIRDHRGALHLTDL